MTLFTIDDRERLQDRVLELAESDKRVVSGAVVGSLALNEGDRWSDLDLTFAVKDSESIHDVFQDWTNSLVREFNAVRLFDVQSGPSTYRVFLLPGCLQFDLSFTHASRFGARGPKFKLLFGTTADTSYTPLPDGEDILGYAIHHALRARICIERRRFWHAEYWISGVRDYGLTLACLRLGLQVHHGRGFDDLPCEIHDIFRSAFVRSLDREELLRALECSIAGLLSQTECAREMAAKVEQELRKLTTDWH